MVEECFCVVAGAAVPGHGVFMCFFHVNKVNKMYSCIDHCLLAKDCPRL